MKPLVVTKAQKQTAGVASHRAKPRMRIPFASLSSAPLWFSAALLATAHAQAPKSLPTLNGIARLGDRESIVLAVPRTIRPGFVASQTLILHEHEREGDVVVAAINLAAGTAELSYHGSNLLLHLSAPNLNSAGRNQINLTNAPLDAVLKLLAAASNRTLLEHPQLPAARCAVMGSADDPLATTQIFAQALTNHGIAIIPDGEKFLQLVPQHLAEKVRTRSGELKSTTSAGASEADLPARTITFISAKMSQIAPIYASLIGREFDRAESPALNRPLPEVSLQTQTPLSKAEICYALDVVLAWCGVKIEVIDDKRVRLALLNER